MTSTCSPAAGTNGPCRCPSCSVTVKVCGWPTSLVAFGAIVIFALTHVFVASALSPAVPSPVARVSGTPPTVTVGRCALTVVTPVVLEVSATVQRPGRADRGARCCVVDEAAGAGVDREGDRRARRRVHEAVAVAVVHVDVAGERVRRADPVRRRLRRDLDVRVDVGLDRVDRSRRPAPSVCDRERRAVDRERRGRVPGHLAGRRRGERRSCTDRSRSCSRPAPVQLAGRRSAVFAPFESVSVTSTCSPAAATKPLPVSFASVTVKVCGVPDLVRRARRDRDLRVDPGLRRVGAVADACRRRSRASARRRRP